MKKLLAALACLLLLCSPTYAQKTKAALTTEVNTNWPDNTTGLITPLLLRTTVIDIINSYFDFGGASSFACPANQVITQYTSLADNVICAQLAFNQLSSFQQNEVSNVDLAMVPAFTLKGNVNGATSTPGDFTLTSLTQKVTPANADLLILGDSTVVAGNGGFALKSVPWSSIPGISGAVTSLNTLAGALSIKAGNGITVTSTPSTITIAASVDAVTINDNTGKLVVAPTTVGGASCTPGGSCTPESLSVLTASTGGVALSQGSTSYFLAFGSTVEAQDQGFWPVGGTFDFMYVNVSAAPGGAGKSWVFTLRINGSNTILTCTVSNAATGCSDLTHAATITAGQTIDISAVPTGGPAIAVPTVTMQFQTP